MIIMEFLSRDTETDERARAAGGVVQIQCQDTAEAARGPRATAEEATQSRFTDVTI